LLRPRRADRIRSIQDRGDQRNRPRADKSQPSAYSLQAVDGLRISPDLRLCPRPAISGQDAS
jgi:hypothetical protein